MYQKYAITVDKNSQAAEKFYEEQIKSYIECISKNVHFTGMYMEHFVTSTVSEEEENGKLVIRISEEWTEKCKAVQKPEEYMSWDRRKLISEYLDSSDDVKKAVRMQYAKRATDSSCNDDFGCNELIVFDSEYMEKPLYARSDCWKHISLPISNIIPVEELPDKVWNTATINIVAARCEDEKVNVNNFYDTFYFTYEESMEDEYISLGEEKHKIYKKHARVMKKIEAELGTKLDWNECYLFEPYIAYTWAYYDSGVFTKAEILKIVDCANRLMLDSQELNLALCGDGLSACVDYTILMYSDDFDAAEIFYDYDTDKVMCRYYENGKTAIDEVPEEKPDKVEDVAEGVAKEDPSEKKEVVLTGKNFTLHINFKQSKLAKLLRGKPTAPGFLGKVIIKRSDIEIYTDAETLQEAFEKAYRDNAELVEGIRAIIGGKSIEELEASGRITRLNPMAAKRLETEGIDFRKIAIGKMVNAIDNSVYDCGKLIRYYACRKSLW